MRRIRLVAWHVFKESVRDRVLLAIAAFAVVLVVASVLIGQITAGQDVKIIKDIGLATLELSGVLMAVFIGVGLVAREIERRSIYSLLAKPVARWEFVVGKYIGLVGTIAFNVTLMTVALFLMLAYLQWKTPDEVERAWLTPVVDPGLLKAVILIGAELALLTAVALFFSTFSSSGLLSAGLTLGVFVVGLLSEDLRGFTAVDSSQVLAFVVRAVGVVVPAFSAFDIKADVVNGRPPVPWAYVGLTIVYATCYASALVGGAAAIFSRREFT
ncbi:MAG: ABC transporter permease [Acidobacteria bacterium]|jgi:Cu-processing system permease protein|nr:ABC transporter permease [Acidobacteriota bacterium]